MSAFLVDPKTIGILAAYAAKHGLLKYAPCHDIEAWDATTAAEVLAKCNMDSVNHRYPGKSAAPDFLGITSLDYIGFCVEEAQKPLMTIPIEQIAKYVDCLDYQCCEITSWYVSDGYKILTAIRLEIMRKIFQTSPAYLNAKWG